MWFWWSVGHKTLPLRTPIRSSKSPQGLGFVPSNSSCVVTCTTDWRLIWSDDMTPNWRDTICSGTEAGFARRRIPFPLVIIFVLYKYTLLVSGIIGSVVRV